MQETIIFAAIYYGLVVQWIEQKFPKLQIQVRFLSRLLTFHMLRNYSIIQRIWTNSPAYLIDFSFFFQKITQAGKFDGLCVLPEFVEITLRISKNTISDASLDVVLSSIQLVFHRILDKNGAGFLSWPLFLNLHPIQLIAL